MAGTDGPTPQRLALDRALAAAPHGFSFFQALRRIECADSDKARLGRSLRAADDPVRLAQEPSLAFAPSTLSSFSLDSAVPRLTVNFFGLLGPNGPLPLHLSEYARDRLRNNDDPTLVSFLDIFHHRMLSLYYRAWADTQPTVSFDRPKSDRFAVYLGALFGIAMESLRDRDAAPDLAKLYYAGTFSCQTRHPDGLRAILRDYFELPVAIAEFVGEWMDLPADGRWRLGASTATGSLGKTIILGSRVWGAHHKFRVILGPVRLAEYRHFLPGAESLRRLAALIRNYVGDELAWDLQLILKGDEVPKLELGKAGRLGWTTWLGTRATDRDADELILDPFRKVA